MLVVNVAFSLYYVWKYKIQPLLSLSFNLCKFQSTRTGYFIRRMFYTFITSMGRAIHPGHLTCGGREAKPTVELFTQNKKWYGFYCSRNINNKNGAKIALHWEQNYGNLREQVFSIWKNLGNTTYIVLFSPLTLSKKLDLFFLQVK